MIRALTGRRGTGLIVSALALLVCPILGLASAQQATAPTDELIQAILRYAFRYEGGRTRLVAGRVPEDLEQNYYAPPGTRVLGTILSGSTAVVLATTSTPSDSLRAEYARALEPRGWMTRERRQGGGFIAPATETPLIFCRQGAQLFITHRRRPSPPHDLQLEYREGGGMCDEPSAERAEFVGINRPPFPTLRLPEPPPGRPMQSCLSRRGFGGRSSMGTATSISTELSPAELLQHFGRQLEASGWARPGTGATRAPISATWMRADSAKTQVTLEVTEHGPGSGCYEVRMQLSQ